MLQDRVGSVLRRLSEKAYILQAGREGRALASLERVRQYDALRELVARYRLDVGTILYIGANEGQEAEVLLRACPRAVLHCFEPQSGCQAALQRLAARWPGRVEVHALALSDRTGEAVLTRPASHDQASSLLRPNDEMGRRFPHVSGWSEETVAMTTLDAWAAARDLADDVLVKMDVQGAEPLVLRGGEAVVQRARMLLTELAVVPTYEAAPDMVSMFTDLRERGFGYAGELGQVRDEQQLVVEFDGAFVRPQPVAP